MKVLESIKKQSKTILGDYPEKRAALVQKITKAENELDLAEEMLEAAEDLKQYDAATEKVKRAELEVKFARNALTKLDQQPRMDEADYNKAVESCRKIMDVAVASYRKEAVALMDKLKALTDDYKQTAEEVNQTLEELDRAANVLQSKYPCDEHKMQGAPSTFTPNRNAWKTHALRYDAGTVCDMATCCEPDPKNPHFQHDSILAHAWRAVSIAYPRQSY